MSCLEHIWINWLLRDIAEKKGMSIVFVGLDRKKEVPVEGYGVHGKDE